MTRNRNDAPTFEELASLSAGNEITRVGAIKPNHKTQKHKFYLQGGSIRIRGDISNISASFHGPPLVKLNVRVGKKTLFGLGAAIHEVISCG